MKVAELSKELNVTSKELIEFFNARGGSYHSHMQAVKDEDVETARAEIQPKVVVEEEVVTPSPIQPTKTEEHVSTKQFKPDDMIAVRSVCPWELVVTGIDKTTVYNWTYFGDVDYMSYRDLQYYRRKDLITKPKVIIEDPDLISQWRREIGDIYKPFIGVEYPEELLELPDDEFENLLKNGSPTVREIIKVTTMSMIKGENYPDLKKILLIDNILGTCIKEFL